MYVKIKIEGISNGQYSLLKEGNLFFKAKNWYIDKVQSDDVKLPELIIDKKSALEIMHTLLDSVNMLNNQAEKLIEQVEEIIDGDTRFFN